MLALLVLIATMLTSQTGQVSTGVGGKLYPAVSVHQSMRGAKLSTKFWGGRKDGFGFKKFGDEKTRTQPEK